MKNRRVDFIVKVGIFSAAAFILQVIGSVMQLKVGGFLEVEISDLPAIIISFALGPWAGVLTELIKNILHLTITSTGGVGELANFIINGTYVFVCGWVYSRHKTKKNAVVALVLSVIAMVLMGIVANLYIMLPLFMKNADFAARLKMTLFTIAPFNVCKGSALAVISMLVYKRVSGYIK